MTERVLITGGAGFIGSHLADRLLAGGHRVRVLDALLPQVHGTERDWPDDLAGDVERVRGDVRDADAVERALANVDAVVHLAAAVGVGQSMYQVAHYTAVNNLGTAVLLDALAKRPVRRLVVASSMSLYGEGLYADADGRRCTTAPRTEAQLRARRWEAEDADGRPLRPLPTPEDKPAEPTSVYALSKLDQERLCLMLGETYRIPAVALRLFNVYGSRQSLSNPYTGVLAIFASRLLNGRPPLVFEDGGQRRDFVDVRDVARAFELALDRPEAVGKALNVGGGADRCIADIARLIAERLGRADLSPEITGRFRSGDVRHCFADLSRARDLLGYAPQISLEAGIDDLAVWLEGRAADDGAEHARAELERKGLWL
jgi:dTDP-L-rhamnose 4-epimerase